MTASDAGTEVAPSLWVTYRDATGQHLGQVWADAPDGAVWVLPALGGPPVSVRDWEPAEEATADVLEPPSAEPPAPAPDPRPALVGRWVTNARWHSLHLVAGLGVQPWQVFTSCGTVFNTRETTIGGDEAACRGCVLADPGQLGTPQPSPEVVRRA